MMAEDWDPDRYHDTFADQVRKLVEDKAAGHEIVVSEGAPAEGTNVVDLMDAIKRSVVKAESGRPKHENLDDLSKAELHKRATDLDIPGRSGMNREELQSAVEHAA